MAYSWSSIIHQTSPVSAPSLSTMHVERCHPVKNVSFIKLHRVGSGTMHNMLVRFALRHDAFVAIADCKYYQVFPLQVSETMLYPQPQHPNFTGYNMFIDHVVFNRTGSDKFLPPDVVYISQIRHPYPHSFSVYNRYRANGGLKVPYNEFLHNSTNYEKPVLLHSSCPHKKKISISRNFMSLELGYPKQSQQNKTDFLRYLHNLDTQLHHVSILEKLTESLVLLRRKMCWHSKDILYLKLSYHKTRIGSKAEKYSDALSTKHKKWDSLDYMLYDFFLKRHEREVSEQDETFQGEVQQMLHDQKIFAAFCTTICNVTTHIHKSDTKRIQNVLATNVTFPTTQFYDAYEVSYQDCVFLQLEEKHAKKSLFFQMNPSACSSNRDLAMKLKLNCDTKKHVIPGLTVDTIEFLFHAKQCSKYYGTK